eukprot:CAMPEP_0118655956 /NCGR_PEP_ID=MMETSP0785-20121206/13227_1 /TAXON_ID=91992 /ORGANISM="Bolidomonas pacifica, Strain CCMP 1866" /LENGTH=874 /DNA_ID=CAMNT_0006548773 /DNA_START=115 /DNA_END=2736 /DNA_ORIENTATION=+
MSIKLRDLIRSVRSCKTASEERSVISRESAMIRTAIREENDQFRHRNVAKLLFMHMLGYPTHFGQLECLKLIASPHFPEKRIGYLGLMLLLSEEADVLMLATNSLKNDLGHSNQYIVGLALCTIGNLSTPDMSRDLCTSVDKHLRSGSPYIRKKAALAMCRCLEKCPDMIEDFTERIIGLVKDRTHGVLITSTQLMAKVVEIDPETGRGAFTRLVPSLVRLLRNLLSMGYSPEHDVSGISDPFLQVSILRLLRLLGKGNEEASEGMNDILAQVATNTETAKNAGNAILYECVNTIMEVESEDGLRVLAINILGRFLLNRDNNIRYVALNTLGKVVLQDSAAVQRHRTTIVDCLKDPDISIRTRALDLIFKLVNRENVESLTAELLNYLVVAQGENKSDICTKTLKVVENFSPNDRWRVDTLITLLTISGKDCKESVLAASIVYISSSSDDLKAYATHKLAKAMRDDDGEQEGLLIVAVWCIGEFGEMLLHPYTHESVSYQSLDAMSVVDSLVKVTKHVRCTQAVKRRALTCFAKLTQRFGHAGDAVITKLKMLVKKHSTSMDLELQVRACEFSNLIEGSAGMGALARMPVVDPAVTRRKNALSRKESLDVEGISNASLPTANGGQPNGQAPGGGGGGGDLLDLDDIFGGGGGAAQPVTQQPQQPAQGNQGQAPQIGQQPSSDMDLLSDIFAAPAAAPAAPAPTMGAPVPPSGGADILDMFGGGSAQPPLAPAPSAPAPAPVVDMFAPQPTPAPAVGGDLMGGAAAAAQSDPVITAYSKDSLTIDFECKKLAGGDAEVTAYFKNGGSVDMTAFNFQVAVPKYIQMEMLPPSSTTIPQGGGNSVSQKIKVTNSMIGQKKMMMKLKISFMAGGRKVE